MIEFIKNGGPVMYPLLICSIITLTVIIERAIFWMKIKKNYNFLGRKRISTSKIDWSIIYGIVLYIIFFQILTYKEIKFILPAIVLISTFSLIGINNLNIQI